MSRKWKTSVGKTTAKRFLIAAALLGSAAATPALAQSSVFGWDSYGHGYGTGYRSGYDLQRQIDEVERQINRAEELDRISPFQERRLLRQLAYVERLFRHYRTNGINAWERRDIIARLRTIRRDIWSNNRWDDYQWGRDRGDWHDRRGDYRWNPRDDDDDDDEED